MPPDPQFGVVKILRPWSGFAATYAGKVASAPLMFSEGGNALDPLAGTTGYSPSLLAGLKVPLGARVLLWLPVLTAILAGPPVSYWNYKWQVTWRFRNVYDFRQSRIPFHYPKQSDGVADTLTPAAPSRVVIPAATDPVLYAQPRPELWQGSNNFGPTALVQAEFPMVDGTNTPLAPYIPGGTAGYYEQGLTNPATTSQGPTYIAYEVQAKGDEMLIGVSRDALANYGTTPATETFWDFVRIDTMINSFFGSGSSSDIGVYVTMGIAP